MIVSIHQPNFMPWAGFFSKALQSDVFILFDDVQFPRGNSYGNHANIKTSNGQHTLNVPIKSLGADGKLYSQVLISDDPRWRHKTIRSIELAYSKAPFYELLFPRICAGIALTNQTLREYNVGILNIIFGLFAECGLMVKTILSSSINIQKTGEDKILGLLEYVGATSYISGTGAGSRRYINSDDFEKHNIKLIWQDFKQPVYRQMYGDFVPNLSVVDMLFNCGVEETYRILKECHEN